jgi:hypothetical protein
VRRPGDTANARLVAIQDGDGAFETVHGENGIYDVRVSNERFGVVIGCKFDAASLVTVIHQTVDDGTVIQASACEGPVLPLAITGTVRGVSAGDNVSLRTDDAATRLTTDAAFVLAARAGKNDLFAIMMDAATNRVVKLTRTPGLDPTSTDPLSIDFTSQGVPLEDVPLRLLLPSGETPVVNTSILTPTSSYPLNRFGMSPAGAPSYQMLPSALRQPDDLALVEVRSSFGTSSVVTTGDPAEVEFPAPYDVPPPVLLEEPYVRPVFKVAVTAGGLPLVTYHPYAFTDSVDGQTEVVHDWEIYISAKWAGGTDVLTYVLPDLSGLSDFGLDLALQPGQAIAAGVNRDELSSTEIAAGQLRRSSESTQTFLGAFCGNGIVDPGEDCDTGAVDSFDCDSDCTFNVCGDGHVNSLTERCDPPNGTTCSATCAPIP